MALKFSEIAEEIGRAVEQARFAVERQSAEMFGEILCSDDGESKKPLTQSFKIEAGGKERIVNVPLYVLMNHKPLLLDSVEVDVPLWAVEEEEGLKFAAGSANDIQEGRTGVLRLKFTAGDTPEGMARVVQKGYEEITI